MLTWLTVKIKNYLYATSYDTCTVTQKKILIKNFVGTSSIIHFILLIHFRENIKKRKGKKKKKTLIWERGRHKLMNRKHPSRCLRVKSSKLRGYPYYYYFFNSGLLGWVILCICRPTIWSLWTDEGMDVLHIIFFFFFWWLN